MAQFPKVLILDVNQTYVYNVPDKYSEIGTQKKRLYVNINYDIDWYLMEVSFE